jgi:hypothetical protein
MESRKKHIEDNYQDVLILENYEINKYFIARYVFIQHGNIKAIFANYRKLPDGARDFYASPLGKNNITFFFDETNIFKAKPDQYVVNEVEELENADDIYKLFRKGKEETSEKIIDQEIKKTIEQIINLQKYAIERNSGERKLSSLLDVLRINYFNLNNISSFMHNIIFKDYESKLIDIWISFNYGMLSISPIIKIRESCNGKLLNYFEIDLLKNHSNYNYERLRIECNNYQNKFMEAEYLISILY